MKTYFLTFLLAAICAGAGVVQPQSPATGTSFVRWSLLIAILVLGAGIAAGTLWYGRHVLGGRTTYWRALLAGAVIGVCTGLVYVT